MLALVTEAFGGHGGIAQYNRDFLSALSRSGHIGEVTVIPRSASPEALLPARIRQVRASGGRLRYSARSALSAMRQRFDLIFCGHLYAAPLADLLGGMIRTPVWLQLHGIEAWERPSTLVRQAVERAALVTSVSRYTRRRLLQWADLPPFRAPVLPNTVAPMHFPGRKPGGLVARYRSAGRKVILTVSRLAAAERYKGHDLVIAALPQVRLRHPNALYLIVGDGDDSGRLKALAAHPGLGDAIQFAGQVPADELADHFRLADVFVMPSTGEGFGIVFLEAAACGLPVIGAACAGSPDALADGRIGRLVDPKNPTELVDAIVAALDGRLLPDPEAVARFRFDNFARQVNDLVRRFH